MAEMRARLAKLVEPLTGPEMWEEVKQQSEDKLIVIDIHKEWCGRCGKQMEAGAKFRKGGRRLRFCFYCLLAAPSKTATATPNLLTEWYFNGNNTTTFSLSVVPSLPETVAWRDARLANMLLLALSPGFVCWCCYPYARSGNGPGVQEHLPGLGRSRQPHCKFRLRIQPCQPMTRE